MKWTLPFFDSWYSLAASNDRRKDVSLHSDTKRQRHDIEKQEISRFCRGRFSGQNTCLHSSSIGNSFVRVDALYMISASA
jgi:NAD-specific glutamate dehydrogenase